MDLKKIGVLDRMDFIVDKQDVMSHYVDYWYRLLDSRNGFSKEVVSLIVRI